MGFCILVVFEYISSLLLPTSKETPLPITTQIMKTDETLHFILSCDIVFEK
jgi:hypothetical protein